MAAKKTKEKEQFLVGVSSCGSPEQFYLSDYGEVYPTLAAAKAKAGERARLMAGDLGESLSDCTVYIVKVVSAGQTDGISWTE